MGEDAAEEAETAEVAVAEAEEDLVEEEEAGAEAEEAEVPQPLIPMTQARAILPRIGGH